MDNTTIISQISHFLPCLDIAHHIPGRIRLKLSLHALGQMDAAIRKHAQTVLAMLGEISGVNAIRINPVAMTCVIEYDTEVIPSQAWPDFLEGRPTPESEVLLQIVKQKYLELCSTHEK